MKKLVTLCAISIAAAAPATAAAATPSPTDYKNAAKFCKAWKASSGSAEAFRSAVDAVTTAKVTTKNAYGKCVSFYAKQRANEDAQQEKAAKANAAKQCKAERDDPGFAAAHGGKTFEQQYGTNKNGNNAYGKCVSGKAEQNKAEADKEDRAQDQDQLNAAKTCKKAKNDDPGKFAADYGSGRNAYGKCVSKTARQNAEQRK